MHEFSSFVSFVVKPNFFFTSSFFDIDYCNAILLSAFLFCLARNITLIDEISALFKNKNYLSRADERKIEREKNENNSTGIANNLISNVT